MGAIGGMLGLGGGASGTGFQAPQQAGITEPVTATQVNASYNQNQNALQQQQALLNALQGQNGIQNQSSVFNQLQGIANGTGPNPAQAMLNQQTGQNVANQAALMAGQRGAGANAGLIARQAAQVGGNLQQQAIGQGATMQANQSLNALNNLGSLASNQVANQMNATNAVTNANQAEQGNLLNAVAQANNAKVGSQSSVNSGNSALAQNVMGAQQSTIGNILNQFIGGGSKMLAGAHGGVVPGYADGGSIGPQSSLGQFMTTVQAPMGGPNVEMSSFIPRKESKELNEATNSIAKNAKNMFASSSGGAGAAPTGPGGMMSGPAMKSGGMVNVMLSPGERVVDPGKVDQAASGNVEASTVPGNAKVKGDSNKNDTYKTKLKVGSVVIPRSKSGNDKDSASFVRNVLAKRGRK